MTGADRLLADRDRDLPRLAEVLDPMGVADHLASAAPAVGVASAEALYVRYKPATNCLVSYRFHTTTGPVVGYVKTVRRGSEGKIEKMALLGAVVIHPDLAIALLPNDVDLPALKRFGSSIDDLLERLGRPRAGPVAVRPLSYKPERRFVGVVESESGPEAVLRAYTSDDYAPAKGGIEAFPSDHRVATPTIIGKSNRHHALTVTWSPGDPLSDHLSLHPEVEGRRLGVVIRHLHHRPPDRLPPARARHTVARRILSTWQAVRRLHPSGAELPPAFAERLVDRMNQGGDDVPIHGDLSADQVLVGRPDGRLGIIDWDHAGLGDPVWDLGCFLADLELRALEATIDRSTADAWREALIEGYGDGSIVDRVDLATAAGLIALSTEPFRRRRPGWDTQIDAIVGRARQLAE